MSTVISPTLPRARVRRPATARTLLREQGLVAGGQLVAGVGNLVFALLTARILDAGAFAQLAVFLALFLVVHVPLSALSAGSAVTPAFARANRARAAGTGLLAGVLLASGAVVLGPLLDVDPLLLVVLAAGLPAAGWLALERGRLLGEGAHGRAVTSLVAEPVLRIALGLPLAGAFGAVGGAVGVIAGGWLALAATRPGLPWARRTAVPGDPEPARAAVGGAAGIATFAFLLLAILQNADVVLANAVLQDDEAGRFAILSTIGGVAAFATTTIPLVLLPRVKESPRALHAALGAAAVLGAGAVGAVALVPDGWIGTAFGARYEGVAPFVVPYVGAMALLGVGRVVVAERVASGRGRALAVILPVLAAAQIAGVLLIGTSAGSIAFVTVATMGLLVAAGGVLLLRDERSAAALLLPADAAPVAQRAPREPRRPRRRGGVGRTDRADVPWAWLAGLTVAALLVRLAVTRGVWLDEAISITQAQMSWSAMFDSLAGNDVHPPLHHIVLWVLAHTLGTDEWVMRAPSILAGTLLVPAMYALGHVLWDRRAGLLAAAMGAVAPFLVWYAQEARMYAFFMLFAVLALVGQAWVLRGDGRWKAWALYVAATSALLWTQYFAIAFVGAQQLAFLVAIGVRLKADRRDGLRFAGAWLAAGVVILATLIPLAPLTLDQFQANEAAGRGFDQPSQAGDVGEERPAPGIYAVITNLVWALVGYHSDDLLARLTALWPLAMLAALFLLGRRPTWRAHLVIACALIPAALLLAAGMAKPFLFEIRYFVATAPLLIVLVARGLSAWTSSRRSLAVLSTAVVAVLGVATVDELLNGANPRRYDFKGALAQVEAKMRPGDVLVYEPQYLENVIGYYGEDLRAAPLDEGIPDRRWAKRVFVLSSFQDLSVHRRATQRALRRLAQDRTRVDSFSRPQVEVQVYR